MIRGDLVTEEDMVGSSIIVKDVPDLVNIGKTKRKFSCVGVRDVMAVTTRAQARAKRAEESQLAEREQREAAVTTEVDSSQNHPVAPKESEETATITDQDTSTREDQGQGWTDECPGVAFDAELFEEKSPPDASLGVNISATELGVLLKADSYLGERDRKRRRDGGKASTGFSPFELVYGRQVRGPLDILKETWKTSKRSTESVVSYVLDVQEKLARMSELVVDNLKEAQKQQKRWYDSNARMREFKDGDQVLVLLPSSTSMLLASWQGPYVVKKRLSDVTYEVDMSDKKKRKRIFHVNMLRAWHTPQVTQSLWAGNEEEVEDDTEGDDLVVWNSDAEASKQLMINEQLEDSQKIELLALLKEFDDVLQNTPGKTNLVEYRIHTDSAPPLRLPAYRLPYAYRGRVKKELDDMLKLGIIEPSASEWASPMVVVAKKDGALRICVDFRRLNAISKYDAYPMQRIDELVDKLGKARFVTTVDLTKGYWQVPIAEEDKPKTAFTTPFGLFQFTVMPFGLQGTPSTFQRMMDTLIRGMEGYASAYIDDVAVYSSCWREHIDHLRNLFLRLRKGKPQG
eukprot:Em0009g836a